MVVTINTIYPTVLSFTTIPQRFHVTVKIIKDILMNLSGYEYLVLNIPKRYNAPHKASIPDSSLSQLPKDPRFILNFVERDLGPITKLYPTYEMFRNQDINLIIFDDNFYHLESFKTIAEKQDKQHDKSFTYWRYLYKDTEVPQGVDIISFWCPNLEGFKLMNNDYCKKVDDLVIANFLKQKGIQIVQLDRKWKWAWKPTTYGVFNNYSLFGTIGKYSRENSMEKCYDFLNK